MDKKRFITACIVTVVLAFGTYFGLNMLFPYHPEEIQVGETAELSEVLAGSLSPAPPDGTPTNIGTTEELKAAGKTLSSEPLESAPAAEAAPTEGEAPASADVSAGPDAAETQTAAAEPAPAQPVAAAEPEPEPAPAPKAPAAKPAPAPAPAAAAKAPEVSPRPVKPAAATPAPATAAAKNKEPIKPWWSGDLADELSAVYVGSLANRTALVVMFNGGFTAVDSLNKFGKVSTPGGARVGGSWELSPNNRRMAIFAVPRPGRYQLALEAGLADSSGKSFKRNQQGAVDVQ